MSGACRCWPCLPDLTLVVKNLILLWSERAVDLQIGHWVLKACALFIWCLMSLRLYWLHCQGKQTWHWYFCWCNHTGSWCLLFTLTTFVFPMLIWMPVLIASSVTQHSFSCASCCLLERRLMSSAKSRSCSCLVNVYWMSVFLPAVDCLMIQSITIRNFAGLSKQPW